LQLYAAKDRNGFPVIKKRTGTAFRCVPARNEPCFRPITAWMPWMDIIKDWTGMSNDKLEQAMWSTADKKSWTATAPMTQPTVGWRTPRGKVRPPISAGDSDPAFEPNRSYSQRGYRPMNICVYYSLYYSSGGWLRSTMSPACLRACVRAWPLGLATHRHSHTRSVLQPGARIADQSARELRSAGRSLTGRHHRWNLLPACLR